MPFTQTMSVHVDAAEPLVELIERWDRDQRGAAPGYQGARLLADQDNGGRYLIEVDFSSREEAERNNERAETQAWAEKLKGFVQGEPEYDNYEVAYTTR
jgi:quinol monooxygenase YgiN